MESKIGAARMAAEAGIPTVIAGGTGKDVLGPIMAGEPAGHPLRAGRREAVGLQALASLRDARSRTPARRRRCPASGRPAGTEPARRRRRLVRGQFDAGDGVELVGPDGIPFGKGLAAAGAAELAARPRGVEAVHRDRLVLY